MERYLVELTGDQLDRLNGMVREAISAAEEENKRELENLFFRLCMISAGRPEIAGATDSRKSPAVRRGEGPTRDQRAQLASRPRRIWGLFQPRPRLPLLPARLELGLVRQRRHLVVGAHALAACWASEAPRTSAETQGRCDSSMRPMHHSPQKTP